jgi:hypothetical protein
MCLDLVITKRIDTSRMFTIPVLEYLPINTNKRRIDNILNREVSYGYKVFNIHGNSFKAKIDDYGLNMWHHDCYNKPIQSDNDIYMSGYHIFPTMKEALKYANAKWFMSSSGYSIYAVEYKNITGVGTETYSNNGSVLCVVASSIKYLRKIVTVQGNKLCVNQN